MYGLDLFSGIGGITKALEGYVQPVAYCEIDRYAQRVLHSRMAGAELPRAPVWDDIRTLRGGMLSGPAEIIYGGFPCQDLSEAGSGAGLAGKRSGLFFEIVRLARELRPTFIFLENVPAIRSRGADIVAGELANLGYDCRWGVLSATDVGAPQARDRWFLLAYAKVQSGSKADSAAIPKRAPALSWQADCVSAWREMAALSWILPESDISRTIDGIPHRVDRARALGNAVVPAQVREAFERLMGIK